MRIATTKAPRNDMTGMIADRKCGVSFSTFGHMRNASVGVDVLEWMEWRQFLADDRIKNGKISNNSG